MYEYEYEYILKYLILLVRHGEPCLRYVLVQHCNRTP